MSKIQQPTYLDRFLVTALWISGILYLGWRWTVQNPEHPWFSATLLSAELFGFCSLVTAAYIMYRPAVRPSRVAPGGLAVDLLIPSYNESLDIIRKTATAALAIRYPHKTWILDDGNRDTVRQLCDEIGCLYLARTDNTHAKAGNLNNALPYCKGEFIAILDVDHVPEQNFLDGLLGYFADRRLAYVQTPQEFYNTDALPFEDRCSARPWHDQSMFYDMGQRGRDALGAATLCGTGVVLRRTALDDIGGFATTTVTEDMHTAVRLTRRGWHSAYHPEPLAFGIAACDYVEFLQQRLRWGHGNIQTLREEGLPFCRGLTMAQRICYLALGLSYFEGWARLAFYLTPPLVLLSDVSPIQNADAYLFFFIPYLLFASLAMHRLGRGNFRWYASEKLAIAKLPVTLLATLGLFLHRRHWRITAKTARGGVPAILLMPLFTIFIVNICGMVVTIALSSALSAELVCLLAWSGFNVWLTLATMTKIIQDGYRSSQKLLTEYGRI